METKNKYNIPNQEWEALGDNQELFNRVYNSITKNRVKLINEFPQECRGGAGTAIDRVVAAVTQQVITELNPELHTH